MIFDLLAIYISYVRDKINSKILKNVNECTSMRNIYNVNMNLEIFDLVNVFL